MLYHPIIKFASKERAKTPINVIFGRHYTATFPQTFKTVKGATNFADNQIRYVEGVWQLPGALKI